MKILPTGLERILNYSSFTTLVFFFIFNQDLYHLEDKYVLRA